MTTLRVGTRGSDLALRQTRGVCDALRSIHAHLTIEEVAISTHGDRAVDQPFDIHWPAGGFVGAIEEALLRGEIDVAVHSLKDLPGAPTPGLTMAAVPIRADAHDLLITRQPVDLAKLPHGFRLGTSSPRRAAQFRRIADVIVLPLRGNVPTRLEKLYAGDLDGVVLAAAGLQRLGRRERHQMDLPLDRFVPAPGQGALAVQTRTDDPASDLVSALDHAPSRRAVEAERSFLRTVNAGCHTALGAYAVCQGTTINLHGLLFEEDRREPLEGREEGADPEGIGRHLAERLLGMRSKLE